MNRDSARMVTVLRKVFGVLDQAYGFPEVSTAKAISRRRRVGNVNELPSGVAIPGC